MLGLGKRVRVLAAGALTSSLLVVGGPQPAQALGSICEHWKYLDQVNIGFDYYGASARCSWIGADTKVRAKLRVNYDYDSNSSWFTALNTTRSIGGRSCAFGCSADHERAYR
jgi:hypothetical protein